MADLFLGIGGVDYATEEAKALQVNPLGEMATENVLKRELILQEESVSSSSPFEHTISSANIPQGAAYIGIYIAATSSSTTHSLTYDVSRNNSFGVSARFIRQVYDFEKPRSNYLVRELSVLPGSSIRLTLSTNTTSNYSLWIVYYRHATPQSTELKKPNRQAVVGTWEITVPAGQSGAPQQMPNMVKYKEYYLSVSVPTTHDWSLSVGHNITPFAASLP